MNVEVNLALMIFPKTTGILKTIPFLTKKIFKIHFQQSNKVNVISTLIPDSLMEMIVLNQNILFSKWRKI
jgi:hypothetical protein